MGWLDKSRSRKQTLELNEQKHSFMPLILSDHWEAFFFLKNKDLDTL